MALETRGFSAVTKHRLELFSDGVFAIVLTLMVLDLKSPSHWGATGLREIAPTLLIHMLAFSIISNNWISHCSIFERICRVDYGTLEANLVGLFFITLVPFSVKLASENPSSPLGVMLLCLSIAGISLGVVLIRPYFYAKDVIPSAEDEAYLKILSRFMLVFTTILFILAGLCWISVWFGYLGIFALQLLQVIFRKYLSSPARLRTKKVATDAQNF